MPRYIKPGCGAVTRAFVLIGDEVVVKTLGVARSVFDQQLDNARRFRASLVGTGSDGQRLGVAPQGSKIKHSDNVLDKNMFIPSHLLERPDKKLDLLFLAYFLRTDPMQYVNEVEVAGWIDIQGILQLQKTNPDQFQSKIRVVSVPCFQLMPMSEFPTINPEINI
jgi:hypothetical protein